MWLSNTYFVSKMVRCQHWIVTNFQQNQKHIYYMFYILYILYILCMFYILCILDILYINYMSIWHFPKFLINVSISIFFIPQKKSGDFAIGSWWQVGELWWSKRIGFEGREGNPKRKRGMVEKIEIYRSMCIYIYIFRSIWIYMDIGKLFEKYMMLTLN